MTAYYNEFDPKAAAWLRELIKQGLIAALMKSNQATCADSSSVTSSPALVGGPMPSDLPTGQITDLFGQVAPLVSPSVQQESAKVLPTLAIFGPSLSVLSPSVNLQRSLENKLQQRLATGGSTLFSLTWKVKATPAGRPYCQLVASAPRTSDNDCGSWPTPNAGPQNDTDTKWQERRALLKAEKKNGNGFGMTLGMASQLVSCGLTSNGSNAQTEKPAQLNPAFPLYLMGYPEEWVSCGAQAMQSSLKSRRK